MCVCMGMYPLYVHVWLSMLKDRLCQYLCYFRPGPPVTPFSMILTDSSPPQRKTAPWIYQRFHHHLPITCSAWYILGEYGAVKKGEVGLWCRGCGLKAHARLSPSSPLLSPHCFLSPSQIGANAGEQCIFFRFCETSSELQCLIFLFSMFPLLSCHPKVEVLSASYLTISTLRVSLCCCLS